MKAFFVGVIASIQSFFHPRPAIVYQSVQPKPPVAEAKGATGEKPKCQISFYVGTPKARKYQTLGKFEISEGAYGDGSEQAPFQFEDLFARLKPIACENGGNAVLIQPDPAVRGVRKADLILLAPRDNS